VLGVSMLLLLFGLKFLSKKLPKIKWAAAFGPILACIISIAAVAIGGLQNRGIKIVEKIPQGVMTA
jgi:MFS superfamily sulfate permease-like transporter